ncbi:MAG: hypothetical protein H8E21_08855, partial [Gammaproteobacteria bacterium]|nr:hypothetical protein [Gammaproteobacteria bacterium]
MSLPSKTPEISTPEELVIKMQELADNCALNILGEGISRVWLERKLGFVYGSLWGRTDNTYHKEWTIAVDVFEEELKQKEGGIKCIGYKHGTPRKLREHIKDLLESEKFDELPARKVGCGPENMSNISLDRIRKEWKWPHSFIGRDDWAWAVEILEEYNDEIGDKATFDETPSKNPEIKTKKDLKEALKKLVKEKILPLAYEKNEIARRKLEKDLKFVYGSLSGASSKLAYVSWKEVVDEIELELIKEFGQLRLMRYEYGSLNKLEKLLDHWRKPRNWHEIPVKDSGVHDGNLGHLNLLGLYELTDLPKKSFLENKYWENHRKLLKTFNEEMYEAGALGTSWERKVLELKKILDELDVKKELPVNQAGKLNRLSFMMEYAGIADNISVDLLCRRSPKLKEMFAEYDKKLEERGVTGYSGDAFKNELKELIENGNYKLNKDNFRINRPGLAKKLGITDQKLGKTASLTEIIEKEEQKILVGYKKGKTIKTFNVYGSPHINYGACPYSERHKRVFDFEDLVKIYALEIAEKIATAFIAITNKNKGYKQYFATIKAFLKFIATNKYGLEEFSNVYNQIKSGLKIDKNNFDYVCLKFKAEIKSFGAVEGINESSIQYTVITKYGEAKIFPHYIFKRNHRDTSKSKDKGKKPSLAEAQLNEVQVIGKTLENAAKDRGIEGSMEEKDTKTFTLNIIAERESRDDLPEGLVECILEISKDR